MKSITHQRSMASGLLPLFGKPNRLRPRTTYPTVSQLSLRPGPLRLLVRALGLDRWL